MDCLKSCPNPDCLASGYRMLIVANDLTAPKHYHRFWVHCPTCFMYGPQAHTRDEAREAWNRLPRAVNHPRSGDTEIGREW